MLRRITKLTSKIRHYSTVPLSVRVIYNAIQPPNFDIPHHDFTKYTENDDDYKCKFMDSTEELVNEFNEAIDKGLPKIKINFKLCDLSENHIFNDALMEFGVELKKIGYNCESVTTAELVAPHDYIPVQYLKIDL